MVVISPGSTRESSGDELPHERIMTDEEALMCRFLPPGVHLLENSPEAKRTGQ